MTGWALVPHDQCPYTKRRDRFTGRKPCGDGDRDWSASKNVQGYLRHQKPRERRGEIVSWSLRREQAPLTL